MIELALVLLVVAVVARLAYGPLFCCRFCGRRDVELRVEHWGLQTYLFTACRHCGCTNIEAL